MDVLTTAGNRRIVTWAATAPRIDTAAQANDLIGEAWAHEASWVAVPVASFGPEVFQLKTRIFGDIAQKFVNYRLGLAVIGAIQEPYAQSQALKDYIREVNQGQDIWFLAWLEELTERLEAKARGM